MFARRALLLLPLLAAGCATAGQSASSPAPAESDLRVERVSSRAVVVQARQPVQAAFLYLRPTSSVVASWASTPGVHSLAAGSHRVRVHRPLSSRLAFLTATQGGGRSRPGIQVSGLTQGGPEGRLLLVDKARTGRTHAPAAGRPAERGLLVVSSPQPMDAAVLEEVLADFNEDYAGVALDAGALSHALSERLAAVFPGASGHLTHLPG